MSATTMKPRGPRSASKSVPAQNRMLDSGLSLSTDPDTSMVESLQLHLVSEHGLAPGLHMDRMTAESAHRRAHQHDDEDGHQGEQGHPLNDHRFRPGRVMECLMATVEREHALAHGTP
jgi:hypothetical protein